MQNAKCVPLAEMAENQMFIFVNSFYTFIFVWSLFITVASGNKFIDVTLKCLFNYDRGIILHILLWKQSISHNQRMPL